MVRLGARVAWVVALVFAIPGAVRAGEYRFSFPAAYCEAAPKINGLTAVGVDVGAAFPTAPDKFGWSFAQNTSTDRLISCDVMFPAQVNDPNFVVNLTWQTVDSAPSSPPQVCWGASWQITLPGQSWGGNNGSAGIGTTSASVLTGQNLDIHTAVSILAADMTNNPCATQGDPNTCAGSHGELILRRRATCPSDSIQSAVLTRIEIVGTTP